MGETFEAVKGVLKVRKHSFYMTFEATKAVFNGSRKWIIIDAYI
jgi:hypothetical protein